MYKNKAVFLDRDGTINEDKGYLYRIEDFVYLDGAVDALRMFHKMEFLLIIVTNQSGIARGYYTEENMKNLHEWLVNDLAEKEVPIAGIYYCPHHPMAKIEKYRKNCRCRKPGTMLFRQAAEELQIEMDESFVIGDKIRDLEICRECGAQGILLGDDFEVAEGEMLPETVWRCRDWVEVMKRVKNAGKGEVPPFC